MILCHTAPLRLLAAISMISLIFLFSAMSSPNEPDRIAGIPVAELDEIFSGWDSSDTPGCAIGVSEDGRTLMTRAWGMADLENPVPNTSSTIFEAGSVSKQFVAAAVILLAMDGELSLEDDIREFVPELPDYGYTITLRHLLNHTSGLRDWGSVAAISGWGRGQRTHNHDHVIDILSRQTRLNFPPGERYSYSNSGYNLLAVAVERVSGQSFASFSDEHLFEPLGMISTQWRDDYTRIVPGRSSAYSGSEDSETFRINRPIEQVHGNGGLLTTVGDLLTWNHAVSGGFFGDEFYDELVRQGVLNSGRTIAYASGVRMDEDHGRTQVVHTGATSGYRAYLSYYPEQELSVALLCNVTGANPGALGSAISGLFLPDGESSEEVSAESIEPDEVALSTKTGIWKDSRNYRPIEIVLDNGELKLSSGTVLTPVSDDEFVVGSGDNKLRFVDADGDRPNLQWIRSGYEEELLLPTAFAEDDVDPEEFTGTFYSPDAETELRIKEENGKLIAHRRPSDTFELEPVYEDAFRAPGLGVIYFHRDENGEISQFSYSSGRVYDLRFFREE